MFGLLQVCLLSVFAEGCWTDSRRKAPPGEVSLPGAFIPKQDEKPVDVRKDGLSGFLPACVIWLIII